MLVHNVRNKSPHANHGLTLVELMISLTIVGILVSIALPAWSSYTVSVRESAAMGKLSRVSMALEQYFGEHTSYQTDLRTLKIPDSDKWFNYSISNGDRYSYAIEAIPSRDSKQRHALRLDHLGRQLHRPVTASNWQAGWP